MASLNTTSVCHRGLRRKDIHFYKIIHVSLVLAAINHCVEIGAEQPRQHKVEAEAAGCGHCSE